MSDTTTAAAPAATGSVLDTLKNFITQGGDLNQLIAQAKTHLATGGLSGGAFKLPPAGDLTALHAEVGKFVTTASAVLPVVAAFDPDPTTKAIATALPAVLRTLYAFAGDIEAGNDPTASINNVLGALRGLKPSA